MAKVTDEKWSLGGVAMSVEDDTEDGADIRIARLGPLDSTLSVHHYGGLGSHDRELKAVMWSYSGYVNQFMPLIGSGYHALVSDQGAEGQYFIVDCEPERLVDFVQCDASRPVRLDITLKKLYVSAEPEMPRSIMVATQTNGIYYTSDFTGWGGADPTWATQNTGLPVTTVEHLDVDHINHSYQYVRLANNDIYIRNGTSSGSWSLSLQSNEVGTDTAEDIVQAEYPGNTYVPDGYVRNVFVDIATAGTVYCVFAYTYSPLTTRLGAHLLKSTDYGANWAYECVINPNDRDGYVYAFAHGNNIYLSLYHALSSSHGIISTSNGGGAWTRCTVHAGLYDNKLSFDINTPGRIYVESPFNDYIYYVSAGGSTVTGYVTLSGLEGYLYFSPLTVNKQVAINLTDSYWWTDDEWSSNTSGSDVGNDTDYITWFVRDDTERFLIYGSEAGSADHHISAADWTNDPIAFEGKAGAMPTSAPYTDSIPDNAGGVAINGIQVIAN